jgi:hypothetical protein
LGTKFDIKKPEVAMAEGQKIMGGGKNPGGGGKKNGKQKKRSRQKKGVYESSKGGGILSSGGRRFALFCHCQFPCQSDYKTHVIDVKYAKNAPKLRRTLRFSEIREYGYML